MATMILILLLGAGASGKSTVFKQMMKLYGQGISEKDRRGYTKTIFLNIFAAMRLLCLHSIKWGEVDASLAESKAALEVEVKDQGAGFDAASIPDPTDPSNLLKTSGRGIFLMRTFMDDIQWIARPEGGTAVRMTKRF